MNAPLKSIDGSADLSAIMRDLGVRARRAARTLALASAERKNAALAATAAII